MAGKACKYPREVTPFAAIEDSAPETLSDLFSLLEPGEATYVITDTPLEWDGLRCEGPLWVKQMIYPQERSLPVVPEIDGITIEPLSCANAAEMVELTAIAFPGFFRVRTCEMGSYYGIRSGGRLVAMCGERMAIRDYREISGLCTHPDFRGQGYAAILMAQLMRDHREAGLKFVSACLGKQCQRDRTSTSEWALIHRGEFQLYLVTRER